MYGNSGNILYKTNMMNYNYLDKVISKLVSETRVLDNKRFPAYIDTHFGSFSLPLSSSTVFPKFLTHCRDIYGLNNDEIIKVWIKYSYIIDKKI